MICKYAAEAVKSEQKKHKILGAAAIALQHKIVTRAVEVLIEIMLKTLDGMDVNNMSSRR